MTIKGTFVKGVIVPAEECHLPEGTEVDIVVREEQSLGATLLKFAGSLKGNYPSDFAKNHDHYIHGTPKK